MKFLDIFGDVNPKEFVKWRERHMDRPNGIVVKCTYEQLKQELDLPYAIQNIWVDQEYGIVNILVACDSYRVQEGCPYKVVSLDEMQR